MGRRTGIGLVAALACVCFAPPASAGTGGPAEHLGSSGPIDYLKRVLEGVTTTQTGPTPGCDSAEDVTGGGAQITGPAATGHLNASGPLFGANSWQAEGRSTAPAGETVTAWSMCTTAPVTRSSATVNLEDAVAQANFANSCLAGKALSPGAVAKDNSGDVLLLGLFPGGPSTWTFSIANAEPEPAQVTFTTICSETLTVKRRTATKEVAKAKTGKVVAKCKPSEAVVGGGVKVDRNGIWQTNVPALALKPWDSRKDQDKTPDDGYLVKSHNGTAKPVDLTAYASCTPRVPSPESR
jgi:hypothetical protein